MKNSEAIESLLVEIGALRAQIRGDQAAYKGENMKKCKTCFRKVASVDLNIDGKCPICVRYTGINDDIATMNITLIEALKIIEAQKDHIRRLEEKNPLFVPLPEVTLKTSI